MARIRELQGGIYPPLPTFFQESEDLDLPTLQRHIRRISTSGIAGYVVMGTNGEAVHLSRDERVQVIEMAREVTGRALPAIERPRRAGDQYATVATSERIMRELGWRPQYSDLRTLLATAWSWRQAHPNGYAE